LTPYVAVSVDESVQVPREYVKNDEIVLNISVDATSSLKLGNDFIEFKARFAGSSREIIVPMGRVIAIYARENGQGMAFPMGATLQPETLSASTPGPLAVVSSTLGATDSKIVQLVPADDQDSPTPPTPPRPQGPRPSLKRVK
jgi:stringent starvation protein B